MQELEQQPDGEADGIPWSKVVAEFLETSCCDASLRDVLTQLQHTSPFELTTAISPDMAHRQKLDATAFLVRAIEHAISDHTLSDAETQEIRHLARILRVEEGEMLAHHPEEVSHLLSQEIERLLEDDRIEYSEALHKVKLQEVLGLSYDEFLTLTSSDVERALVRLLRRAEEASGAGDMEASLTQFRRWTMALDTVLAADAVPMDSGAQGGTVYVLYNPAMPGMVKIGRTARESAKRVAELSGATGVPVPFVLVYEVRVCNAAAAEQFVHDQLEQRGARVAGNREFFQIALSEAVEMLQLAREAFQQSR
jgi:hypothetical protein